MGRRYDQGARFDQDAVPIDLLRSVVAIVETGSFTKAGNALGLTQSAISAQIKRLQQLVGGDVFFRAGGGLTLTERGKTIDRTARRILEMNEQLLLLSGARPAARLVRIGIPVSFAARMLAGIFKASAAASDGAQVQMRCAASDELLKDIDSGYLDVALIATQPPAVEMTAVWDEPVIWVRSPELLVSPGAPIPYISWPNSLTDRFALGAMEQAGLRHIVSFASADFIARYTAARAGLGFMVLPARAVSDIAMIARERFLPPLPLNRGGICLRDGFDAEAYAPLLRALKSCAMPAALTDPAVVRATGRNRETARPMQPVQSTAV